MSRQPRMKFGVFMAPFHRVGENPTLALERDLELIELLDRLDFDEVWIGEHHSAGRELIAEPMLTIAAASQRTRKIMLGTGVTSLPYHHPFMVADRLVQLDHMTRGRAMLGIGPGLLASDAYMLGIDPTTQRGRMAEAMEAIMRLLRCDEPVTMETDWFTLREARLQIAPYTYPHPPVAVATSFTPSGPQAAGRHGVGLLSVAGADHEAFSRTWGWVEESAAQAGQLVNRADWKVVLSFHLAETREQAIEDVRLGFSRRAYAGDGNAPGRIAIQFGPASLDIDEALEMPNHGMVIGTPDDLIAKIRDVQERSGGVGGILGQVHEWADTAATQKSYELLARYVMPVFQGQLTSVLDNRDWFDSNQRLIWSQTTAATAKAFADAGKAVPEEIQKRMADAEQRRAAREAAAREGAATAGGD